jgi:hypothetical protein
MLQLVSGFLVFIAVAVVARLRVRGVVNPNALGWMSEQWLAEYRASHLP